MRTFSATLKKWGNSTGIIIPKQVIEEENIQEGETINIMIRTPKKSGIWEFAGTLKTNKSTDEIMREIDEALDGK